MAKSNKSITEETIYKPKKDEPGALADAVHNWDKTHPLKNPKGLDGGGNPSVKADQWAKAITALHSMMNSCERWCGASRGRRYSES